MAAGAYKCKHADNCPKCVVRKTCPEYSVVMTVPSDLNDITKPGVYGVPKPKVATLPEVVNNALLSADQLQCELLKSHIDLKLANTLLHKIKCGLIVASVRLGRDEDE